ncbi:MAG: LysM peptidoglycan-binding domain-containing protein [Candidatus Margulisbacteria bacterium]|nr:LysM peptidoglycan-binding domain-containing protein [Candidatus Margulisiibacteriota bacterium]
MFWLALFSLIAIGGALAAGPQKTLYHYTSSGDTLAKISIRYYGTDTYARQLAERNGLRETKTRLSNKVIKVPPLQTLAPEVSPSTKPEAGTSVSSTITTTTTSTTSTTISAPVTTTTLAPAPVEKQRVHDQIIFYSPEPGETLREVSVKFYGTGDYGDQLGSINSVMNADSPLSGLLIRVPPVTELDPRAKPNLVPPGL